MTNAQAALIAAAAYAQGRTVTFPGGLTELAEQLVDWLDREDAAAACADVEQHLECVGVPGTPYCGSEATVRPLLDQETANNHPGVVTCVKCREALANQ